MIALDNGLIEPETGTEGPKSELTNKRDAVGPPDKAYGGTRGRHIFGAIWPTNNVPPRNDKQGTVWRFNDSGRMDFHSFPSPCSSEVKASEAKKGNKKGQ
jgi:hypothetical protein